MPLSSSFPKGSALRAQLTLCSYFDSISLSPLIRIWRQFLCAFAFEVFLRDFYNGLQPRTFPPKIYHVSCQFFPNSEYVSILLISAFPLLFPSQLLYFFFLFFSTFVSCKLMLFFWFMVYFLTLPHYCMKCGKNSRDSISSSLSFLWAIFCVFVSGVEALRFERSFEFECVALSQDDSAS